MGKNGIDDDLYPEHDSNSGEPLDIITHSSDGEKMLMETIARGFEVMLWTV